MSRTGQFVVQPFVTVEALLRHYAVDAARLPAAHRQRFQDAADKSNLSVSGFLYRYVDALPLAVGTAEYQFAANAAFYHALWIKAVEDGATNAGELAGLYKEQRARILEVLKAKPEKVNTRVVVGRRFSLPGPPPFSNTFGVEYLLNPEGEDF